MTDKVRYTLFRDNCLELSALPMMSADTVIIDPPFELYSVAWLNRLKAAMPVHKHVVMFSKFPHTGRVQQWWYPDNLVAEFIWHYTDMTSFRAKHMPLIHHETISIFSTKPNEIDLEKIRRPYERGMMQSHFKTKKTRGKEGKPLHWEPDDAGSWPSSVIRAQRSLSGDLLTSETPTGVKPLYLAERLLPAFGDSFIDPFMGSGTFGVWAVQNGKEYTGIEVNHDYYRTAEERINIASAQGRLFDDHR